MVWIQMKRTRNAIMKWYETEMPLEANWCQQKCERSEWQFFAPLWQCQCDGWQMEYLQFKRSKKWDIKATRTCQVSIANVALFDKIGRQMQNLHLTFLLRSKLDRIEAWQSISLLDMKPITLTDYPPLSENLSTKWPLCPNFLHLAHLNFLNYSTAFFLLRSEGVVFRSCFQEALSALERASRH